MMWTRILFRGRFSRSSFHLANGALLLASSACYVTPAHMTCTDVDGSLECTCKFVYADCDNIFFNGCETNTATDANHCGACGNSCAAPKICLNGKCGCSAANCFCADFATDPDNCGACGTSVDDGNACTIDTCVAAMPVYTNEPAGTYCGAGYCNGNGVCLSVNGAACTTNDGCWSGFCADGVCCENACDGTCEACSKAQTGVWDGVCRPILYFTDPADECPNGVCDGYGQCTNPGMACTAPSDCASGFCNDGFCCDSPCTETCMACNVVGNVGTCVPVPMFEDDLNATPPCNGATQSCNGSGVCKGDIGDTCATNAECLSGHCDSGTCGEFVNQPGPVVWELHQDASTPPVDAWYNYQYPHLSVSSLVARNDGSLMGSGTNVFGVFGLGSGDVWYQKGNQVGSQGDYRGPHPFIFDIDAAGQSVTLQSMGQVGWSQQYNNTSNPYTCYGWCEREEDYVIGPHLWLTGGNVGMVREQWHYGPQFGGPSVWTCKFGELTKSGTPSWSLGTAEVCAMQPRGIAGDDVGNSWIPKGAGITQYDPTGQVVQTLPNPFSGMPGHFVLGPQGEFYIGGDDPSGIRLAKADVSGMLQWTKTVPAPDVHANKCFSYAVDTGGNILLAFSSASVVDVGNGPMPRLGQKDLILAKLDPQGNVAWAKRLGGGGFTVKSCSMRRTGSDDFAMVLDYAGMVDLGDGVLPSSPVLAKFDATGALLWHADLTSHFPFVAEEQSWALSGHPSGAVFVSGAGHAPDPVNWWEPRDLRFVVVKYGP